MRLLLITTSAPLLEAISRVLSVEYPSATIMWGSKLLCLTASTHDFMVAASFLAGKTAMTFGRLGASADFAAEFAWFMAITRQIIVQPNICRHDI
jgi:hypothetical protein